MRLMRLANPVILSMCGADLKKCVSLFKPDNRQTNLRTRISHCTTVIRTWQLSLSTRASYS